MQCDTDSMDDSGWRKTNLPLLAWTRQFCCVCFVHIEERGINMARETSYSQKNLLNPNFRLLPQQICRRSYKLPTQRRAANKPSGCQERSSWPNTSCSQSLAITRYHLCSMFFPLSALQVKRKIMRRPSTGRFKSVRFT